MVVASYSITLQLARENNVPLMFTLAQLSYWNAKHLGDTGLVVMQERRRVQVGIPWVIVNGTILVWNSEVQNVRPGQSIRFRV